jgi:D-alanine-D-alanine ligase
LKKIKVLVLCGGRSAESQVSLVSAKLVLSKLDRSRYSPELIFINGRGRWLKAEERLLAGTFRAQARDIVSATKPLTPAERFSGASTPDVVFPILHGPMGEDGTVQGMLELAGIPYVGCGVLGSALGMDKEVAKKLAQAAGIPILPFLAVHCPREARDAIQQLGLPLFVKPTRLGSSVGISKVKHPANLIKALKTAFLYDDKVILERGIAAREIECALLGDPWAKEPKDPLKLQASVCGEVEPRSEFYTYQSKYLDPEGAKLIIPAKIPKAISQHIRELSIQAFRALDGYAMGRVDFLMDRRTGRIYFNEINTIPGFTPASMYPLLWKASGIETSALIDLLIALALRRHGRRSGLRRAP